MKVVRKILELRKILDKERIKNKSIAFVPTMGSLHQGHIALVKKAKKLADIVVVSVFVNKTQFDDVVDYKMYPRQIENDIELLKENKVNFLFAPDEQEIYDDKINFQITLNDFDDCLCGKHRKGHFNGVVLIVTKLLNIVQPNYVVFGEKDYQQLLIIKKLVAQLNFPTNVIQVPTLRAEFGLALSSRNQRLSARELVVANNIFKILCEIKQYSFETKKIDGKFLKLKAQELISCGFSKLDYLEVRDEKNLQLICDYSSEQSSKINDSARIFVAVYLGAVRLIDNLKI